MKPTRKIAVLVGSLRKDSFSGGIAKALAAIAPEELKLEVLPIGDMPFYNQDLETADAPAPWQAFRAGIRAADGLLFITPEYNRSVPAALKNAIDVGSRPYGQSIWNGKPALVVSQSPGLIGGFGANHHLRQSLMCLNVATMPAPEVYLSQSSKLLDADGAFASADTQKFLAGVLATFSAWIDRHSPQTGTGAKPG